MRRIRLRRKDMYNPYMGRSMYGMYGEAATLSKLYAVGDGNAASIKRLGQLLKANEQVSMPPLTMEDLDLIGQMVAGQYSTYTQAMFDLVKKVQPLVGLSGQDVDGKVGRKTWKALGASDAELPAASSGGYTSGGGSASNGEQGSSGGGFDLASLPNQVWFWPAASVTGLAILVLVLRAMKKKKKKTPSVRTNRY